MATYYWVGGSGTWDNTSNTNWSLSSGGAGGAGVPNNTDTVNFDANSGTAATVDVTATATCLNGTVNKSDINLSLSGSPTFAGLFTFTTGTLTLNGYTWTVARIWSNNTNTRALSFGGGKFVCTGGGSAGYVAWDFRDLTNLTLTGVYAVDFTYSGSTGSRLIYHASTAGNLEANGLNATIIGGGDSFSNATNTRYGNLIFSGFTGTYPIGSGGAQTIYGDLTLAAGMTLTDGANTTTFASTSGTPRVITCNGNTINCNVNFNGVGGTWRLVDNMTVGSTRTTTLTNGTLDLDGKTLTTGLFASNNTNTRTLAFGVGKIVLSGSGARILDMGNVTNLTTTGNKNIEANYSGGTGTREIFFAVNAGGSEANAVSIAVTAGTDTVNVAQNIKNLNFTGFSGTLSAATRVVYGNLTFSAGMTINAGVNVTTFAGTSGIQQITSNGKTLDFPATFNGVGGTFRFEDNFAIGATRAFTLVNGTVNANDKNITIGTFVLSSGTKTLTLGSGTWTVAGTSWNANTNVTGLTVSASTGTISMTSASAKTFSGGAKVWPTLNQGGAGNLTIAQSNTFANITNTVQPATIRLTAGTTQTVSAFSVSGTSGNQITLDTTVAGTLATLNGTTGIVNARYVNIKDIRAQGYTEWNALVDQGAVDQGNNPGWNFITLGVKKILRRVFGRQIIRPVIEEIS